MEVLRSKKECIQKGGASAETVPKLIGHIEKVEEEDVEEQPEQTEGDHPAAEKGVSGGLMAGKEANVAGETGGEQTTQHTDNDKSAKPTDKDKMAQPMDKDESVKSTDKAEPSGSSKRKARSTPSINRMKEERKQAKIKEQERRWKEATTKGLGEIPTEELDLEDTMLSQEESDKQQAAKKEKMEEKEGYGKVYTKTHKKRAEQSLTRAERREQEEKHKRQEAERKEDQEAADRMAQDKAKCIIERAQLEEEELAVQKRIEHKWKIQEMAEEKEKETEAAEGSTQGKVSATSKKQWKEHLGLKAKKHKRKEIEEEEYSEVDDEDKDPDYQPEDDLKKDFIVEDAELDEEETLEIEKHMHAINLQEAGDYIVEIRRFVACFGKVVRKAKGDVAHKYRKLIHFMREMVMKINAYGPVEHVDEEAVYKMIIDPTCMAWCRAMHGAKTGNSKAIQRIEEKHPKSGKIDRKL